MNPEEEIQFLEGMIDELLSGIQDVLMSGEVLSDEFQGMLAEELGITLSRIDELRAQGSQEPSDPVEGLSPIRMDRPIPSSNVHSFGYDPKSKNLYVKFQGTYPEQNGPVYSYSGVPQAIFDMFRTGSIPAKTNGHNAWGEWWVGNSPSLGASLSALIKNGGYPYQRLT